MDTRCQTLPLLVPNTRAAQFSASRGNQRRIPILPHRLVAEARDDGGDFFGRAVVGNLELAGGAAGGRARACHAL